MEGPLRTDRVRGRKKHVSETTGAQQQRGPRHLEMSPPPGMCSHSGCGPPLNGARGLSPLGCRLWIRENPGTPSIPRFWEGSRASWDASHLGTAAARIPGEDSILFPQLTLQYSRPSACEGT